ncbi:hypothetical protein [Streptomyces anandii]|uniref:Phospholipase n=1 Tax=Streptomyces anandii TaxID=285454 RepID=A0ABW6H8T7_9ACTN
MAVAAGSASADDNENAVVPPDSASAVTGSVSRAQEAEGPGAVTIEGAGASHTYKFSTVTPAHGKLVPVQVAGSANITSEVMVTDQDGKVLGAYDAPWALDASNRQLAVSYRIDGNALVEVVDFAADTKFPVSLGRPLYSAVTTDSTADGASSAASDGGADAIAASSSGKVTVPSNYIYNPKKGTLHDYCTDSPDSYLSADFRGPCARHDLCYGKKGNHKKSCDATLFAQLMQNCNYAYGSWNPLRYTCTSVASGYYAAVTAYGDDN